jgi:GH35 family endo-1,4-beta-xylanase
MVHYAMDNKMIVQAQMLIAWDLYLPEWMKNGDFTSAGLEEIMDFQIETVMDRYKTGSKYGECNYWVVVN